MDFAKILVARSPGNPLVADLLQNRSFAQGHQGALPIDFSDKPAYQPLTGKYRFLAGNGPSPGLKV